VTVPIDAPHRSPRGACASPLVAAIALGSVLLSAIILRVSAGIGCAPAMDDPKKSATPILRASANSRPCASTASTRARVDAGYVSAAMCSWRASPATANSAFWRERPLRGDFRGDCERLELAANRLIVDGSGSTQTRPRRDMEAVARSSPPTARCSSMTRNSKSPGCGA
jgi:hypothetical protein